MPPKSFLELMQWGPQGWLDEMTFATGLTLAVAVVGFFFGLLFGMLAIGIVSGAYQSEVIRGAYLAIPKGEIDAARAFGMSGLSLLRRVIGPQVLRYGLPGMGNIWQLVLKESALVAVVGLTLFMFEVRIGDLVLIYETRFSDLLRQAHVAAGSTRQPFVFYITAVLFYLVLTTASSWGFRRAETWATRGMRRR